VPRLSDALVALTADGYPGGGDGQRGGGSSTVEAAVGARERFVADWRTTLAIVGRVAKAAHLGASGEMWSPRATREHLEDLLGICDRIYALSEGRITGELPIQEATPEALLRLMTMETPR
jgi:hypothetical protein